MNARLQRFVVRALCVAWVASVVLALYLVARTARIAP